ncbi:hypothetical protein [Pedobacter boryungensis]|uniref:DUF4369 domain-containing protein n=1 Tax=Pedobacter boryungensis TaxID=869962 RepID=A0ABX2DFJ0_9SPHI|nr:hypothetical protein [Pedobacter boryungensis]NQX32868.1 hypothetical protein [Pedobacter boryungensis]
MKILKLSLVSLFIIISHLCIAQNAIIARIKGTPFLNENKNIVEGSPYLFDDFKEGIFFVENGRTPVNNLQIKINLVTNQVSYNTDKGEFKPDDPIKKFIIKEGDESHTFQKGFPEIDKGGTETYYEVIYDVSLPIVLKKYVKTVLMAKQYNSSKTTETYLNSIKYYVFNSNSEMTRFSTDKKAFSTYFPNKENEMLMFLKEKKINVKSDSGLKELFEHYSKIK